MKEVDMNPVDMKDLNMKGVDMKAVAHGVPSGPLRAAFTLV
jgi:hypothetical protein